jgi:hypothetical protein
MLTPILGKMPKTCQFSGRDLAANLSLAANLPALSILAEQYARGATSWDALKYGPESRDGMKRGRDSE